MPVKTYWENDGFVYETNGIVTVAEIQKAGLDFHKVPKGVTPKYKIIKALNIDELLLSEADVFEISMTDLSLSRKYPDLKIAMVAHKGQVTEKFMKYLKISWAVNSSWEIRIFNSLATARDWLNLVRELKKPVEPNKGNIQE